MKYIKQLDSLRAIAVIFVIISHWIPRDNIVQTITNGAFGGFGVDMFFVLSGFLITKILFDNKIKSEKLDIPKSTVLKNFYIRRTLRIFPIYYLTIILLYIFQNFTGANIQSALLSLLTYTSNFYFFKKQAWEGIISHLWSLAVEEQFYLIWPWIILFTNKKYLLQVISAFIFIGVASQYLMNNIKMSSELTFTCFDAFGMGALLAWQITFNVKAVHRFYKGLSIFAAVALLFFILGLIQKGFPYIPFRTLVSAISLWLIAYVFFNHNTHRFKLKFIFNNKILIFLGKISYGIYLYHNIIPATLNSKIINKYLNPHLPAMLIKNYGWYIILTENFILLIVISWLSYELIEKKFLNLKKYFKYQGEYPGKQATVAL